MPRHVLVSHLPVSSCLDSDNSLPVYPQGRFAVFDAQYVKRRSFAQECAISGFRKRNFIFWPHFRQNGNSWSIFDGTKCRL